jgi:hypothetical protein
LDVTTVNVLPGLQDPNVIGTQMAMLADLQAQLAAVLPNDPLGEAPTLESDIVRISNEDIGILFAGASDQALADLESGYQVKAYYASPRLLIATSQVTGDQFRVSLDLLKNDTFDVPYPGQVESNALLFEVIRGLFESTLEEQIVAGATNQADIGFTQVFDAMASAGGRLVEIDQSNLGQLDGLALSATAMARITQAVEAGDVVYTPSQMVQLNGQTTVGWLQTDWSTGQTIFVMEDGEHQALIEFAAVQFASGNQPVFLAFGGTLNGFAMTQLGFLSSVLGGLGTGAPFAAVIKSAKQEIADSIIKDAVQLVVGQVPLPEDINSLLTIVLEIARGADGLALGNILTNPDTNVYNLIPLTVQVLINHTSGAPPDSTAFQVGILLGEMAGLAWIEANFQNDPPVFPFLSTELSALPQPDVATTVLPVSSSLLPGPLTASVSTGSITIANQLTAAWSTSGSASSFVAATLNAASATVGSAGGTTVGSGAVTLTGPGASVSISGSDTYSVNGTGRLSFYGPAESSLGVSGNWTNYSASVTGSVTLTLTTDSLMLNGNPLPAGTYTITTTAATLSGSGLTTSPNFSGTASINAASATINLGPGTGNASAGGNSLNLANGGTLDGYTGTITVAASGNGTDNVTLNGNTGNVLTVSAMPATFTTNQNTPMTFQVNVNTSLADTYNLTTQAPPGWTVSIDSSGKATVTPAAGLQGGTFPIQIIAQSQADPSLEGQTTVLVTVTPTTPGETLNVVSDPNFTVPFDSALVPTAFQVQIDNTGPAPVTENLTFSNVPSGFTLAPASPSPPGKRASAASTCCQPPPSFRRWTVLTRSPSPPLTAAIRRMYSNPTGNSPSPHLTP